MAISRLGVSVSEFYDMSPVEFHFALKEADRKESTGYRIMYENTRLLVAHMWNSAGKSLKNEIKDPRKFISYSWDKEIEVVKQSAAEMEAILEALFVQHRGKIKRTE